MAKGATLGGEWRGEVGFLPVEIGIQPLLGLLEDGQRVFFLGYAGNVAVEVLLPFKAQGCEGGFCATHDEGAQRGCVAAGEDAFVIHGGGSCSRYGGNRRHPDADGHRSSGRYRRLQFREAEEPLPARSDQGA